MTHASVIPVVASDAIFVILTYIVLGLLLGGFLLVIWYRFYQRLRADRDEHAREARERDREDRISGKWAPTTMAETRERDALEREASEREARERESARKRESA